MTWTKLDDDFPDRDEIISLSDAAFRAHVCGLIHANRLLTDGRISAVRASLIAGPTVLAELVAGGVWEATDDGYQIIDSVPDQPTREKVLAGRKANAERIARWRASQRSPRHGKHGKRNGVTNGVSNATPDPSPYYVGRDTPAPNGERGVVSDSRDTYDPIAYERAVLENIARRAAR